MFDIRAHFWWIPGEGPPQAVDVAVLDLLAAVDRDGSLFKAAADVGVSYRHAWALMGKWARICGQPLLSLKRGRGASLTPLATQLLAAQRGINAQLGPHIRRLLPDIALDRGPDAAHSPGAVRIHASHDLALAGFRDELNATGGLRLDIQFQGSLDCLAALARGACDLAGFHFAIRDNSSDATAAFRRWLKPRSQKLIDFVTREQGLMVAAGNPLAIHGLADLARKNVRLINRQRGSGTRMEFDQLVRTAGIDVDSLAGYHTEEFTHLAVAATVAGGLADAGFGIKAAASQFGLHFIPLLDERYLLACRNETLTRPSVQRLLAMLEGKAFKAMVARLPGYDAASSGKIVEIHEILPAAMKTRRRKPVLA